MQNEKDLSGLIRKMPNAAYTCDKDGFIQLYNEAAVKLWGRVPLPGKDKWCGSWQMLNADGSILPADQCPLALTIKAQRPVFGDEIIVLREDGSVSNVNSIPSMLTNADGTSAGALNIFIYTYEQQASDCDHDANSLSMLEYAADGILLFDQNGWVLSANKCALQMLGYDKAALPELNLKELVPGIPNSTLLGQLEQLKSGQPLKIEKALRRKDGTGFHAELSVQMMAGGGIQAIVRDVTDRKVAEEKMQKAIEQYDLLSKATSDTIWDWDVLADKVVYNDGILKMFGYDTQEISDPLAWWKLQVHPFDYKKFSEGLEDVFNKRSPHLQLTYRFKCSNGTYKNIYDRAFVIFDEFGQPVRMIGAMQDVTYLRQEESRIMKATIDAQESERQQIGFELHDNINQILTGCLLNLCTIKHVSVERTAELVDLSREYILTAIDEIRKLSHRLAPAQFDKLSLRESFEGLIRFMNIGNQFAVKLNFGNLKHQAISHDIQLNLYRILQEQLTNIVKYSKATAIEVNLTMKHGCILMKIADNGVGFDATIVQPGIGMNSMKRRTQVLSGTFVVHSAVGQGCDLMVEIPLQTSGVVRVPLTA